MSVPPPQRATTSSGFRQSSTYMPTSSNSEILSYPASMRSATSTSSQFGVPMRPTSNFTSSQFGASSMPRSNFTSSQFGVPSMPRSNFTSSQFGAPMIPRRPSSTQGYFNTGPISTHNMPSKTSSCFYNPHTSSSLYDPERPAMTHAGIPAPLYSSSPYGPSRTSSSFTAPPYFY
jgi:hypothetical protein